MKREDVEFSTLDGLTLRGWLYRGSIPGPAIVTNQGFNTPKEILLLDVAVWFQQQCVTVLSYDNRSIGASDGQPRNDNQPSKPLSDISEDKIALYRYSFSAMTALVAAALDPRVAVVVSVTPITNYNFREERDSVMALVMQDRVSTIAGNEPVYIPFVGDDGLNPAGWGNKYNMEQFRAFLGTSFFTNQITARSYYHVPARQPLGATRSPNGTPHYDEDQKALFELIGEPKVFDLVPDRGHMVVINGDGAEGVLGNQMAFLKEYLEF
ncbi:DltD N-terminal domain protein [Xylaria scruposa]|nr:DltD N-terminal domain protein [Xylaria scruposa]